MNSNSLFAPHQEKTIERIKQTSSNYVLAIQDSTYLNYTTHKAKVELGRIGASRYQNIYGLIQHSTLCVTDQNELLGLMDLQFFHHDDRDTSIPCDNRSLEDKQSNCWLKSLKTIKSQLIDTNKSIVIIADREGDFFDYLKRLCDEQQHFVIRAKYDRYIGKKYRERKEKLFARVEREKVIAHMQVTIHDIKTKCDKTIELNLKCGQEILLPQVYKGRGSIDPNVKPLKVNVVMAYNENYRWILLTNLPVNTAEQIKQVVMFYRCRWHIENFHKILKTAYQAEQIYLHASRKAVENALTLIAMSACRFYWLVYVGRKEHFREASILFEEYEWQSLYIYFKEPVPTNMPSIADIIMRIARLGGYKFNKNAKPPGIKTLWIGFRFFTTITAMYQEVLSCQQKLKAN